MRLWLRITIAVSCLSIFTAISLSVFVNKQIKVNLDKINFELSEALTKSISQSILDYVIEGNTRKTQSVLRRITKENFEIEYIVVVDFKNKLFASSVDVVSLPDDLKNIDHLECNVKSEIKDDKFRGELEDEVGDSSVFTYKNKNIFDYSHPFVNNLSAHIHFGLKNSLYKKSISEIEQYSLLVAVIISILGSIIAYILGKRISLPIEKLSNVVSEFGKKGSYNIDSVKTTDKDILKLTASFKNMFEQRILYESEISAYKENLEELVKERTEKLEIEIREHEITEKELLNEKMVSDKANQSKSEFLSHMSHELRTPLNAVLGFAQLLEMENNDEIKEYTREILVAGHHLLSLINDILDLSIIEAGKLELSIEKVGWNAVICESVVLLEQVIAEKNINLSLNYDHNTEFIVHADRVRLKQASLNLISNAVKYNEDAGSVIISFDVGDNVIRMSVKDTGKGIPDEKQHKLFSPFQRLDMEKSAIDGVGIGLVITKALVESMQGEIGFKSEYGLGSVFWLEFPLAKIEKMPSHELPEDDKTNAQQSKTNLKSLPFDGVKKILYIEDNPSNMKVVDTIFKKYSNIEFYPAYSPSEGFDILKNTLPDLILLDINLPEMDGYEVKKILDQTPEFKSIKVVGLSANAMAHDIEKAKNASFVDYISKPIDINNFMDLIKKILADK